MAGKSYGPGYGRKPRGVNPARLLHPDEFRAFLLGLPGDIERIREETGEPFVVELPAVPDPHSARLLNTLGVEWTVAAVTVTTDQVTVRCDLGCDWSFEGDRDEAVESALWHREQVHGVAAPSSGRLPLNGGYGFSIEGGGTMGAGLDALDRMDRGEPQKPLDEGEPEAGGRVGTGSPAAASSGARLDAVAAASSPSPNGYTRESIVEEIRAYAAEHGTDGLGSAKTPGNRLWRAARKLDLVYADLIEEATGQRPSRGGARKGAGRPQQAGGAPSKPRETTPTPPPEPAPEPPAAEPLTLVGAATALEIAREKLDTAQDAYEDALEAFRSHSLVQQIKNERGF